jgi:hypothetical protein
MDSKLARQARAELAATLQRLTPEQRLDALLQHCQILAALCQAARLAAAPPNEPPAIKPSA